MRVLCTVPLRNWVELNLEEESKLFFKTLGHDPEKNPLYEDPEICQRMVEEACKRHGKRNYFGGLYEDRPTLWCKSYLNDQDVGHLHLGVDFGVDAGTPVFATQRCTVVSIDDDTPLKGGWGTRVIVKLHEHDLYLLYAHLGEYVLCSVGTVFAPGQQIGHIGQPSANGGWFGHLHGQAIVASAFEEKFKDAPEKLDGYGHIEDTDRLKKIFPDPLPYMR